MSFDKQALVGLRLAAAVLFGADTATASSAVCADAEPALVQSLLQGASPDLGAVQLALAACAPTEAERLGRRISALLYNSSIKTFPPDIGLLEASLSFGRSWQALATLGDLAFDKRDWTTAASRLQDALTEIADPALTPEPPPPSVISGLRKRAETAALLSPTYVAVPRTRSGENGGLGASAIRGVAVTSVALPIQFQFDSDAFTVAGQRAADDLARIIASDRPLARQITLIGHTDAKGESAYNDKLSLRRAEAVRRFLLGRGLRADIRTAGMGERKPYQPDDPGRYSAAERDQMNRRVEFRRQ
ncbi:OmpA family protein [Sandarakinorhabdus sp.]|uniref:OmpA family protein n=1 Tax=Sandarakinorhabdus sp. TaxID=1916663 RepID=UPI003F72BC6B